MHDTRHRLALAALFAVGCATLAALPSGGAELSLVLLQRQWLLALLGAALALSPWVPALRLAAAAAGLLVKAGFLVLSAASVGWAAADPAEVLQAAVLAAALVLLWRESQREARWNGVQPRWGR